MLKTILRLILLLIIFPVIIFYHQGCTEQPEPDHLKPAEVEEDEDDKPDLIEKFIESMSLRQKAAALVIVGLEEDMVTPNLEDRWRSFPFGGVIIYERNIIKDEWLVDFTNELQDLVPSGRSLLICIDEEGGSVSRIPEMDFPSASEMGNMSVEEVYSIGLEMAERLAGYGVNMNLAPVLDIKTDSRNLVIGNRSFSSDPALVTSHGISFFRGLNDGGIISVGKHFPGHGSTVEDSHLELPVLNKNLEELLSFELIPFQKGIEAGIPVIMTAHIVVSGVDDKPATMSAELIGLLRNDFGYEGVIISDDLEMAALTDNYSWEEIILGTFMAGVDLLLIGQDREMQEEAVIIIENAYNQGLITEDRLNRSLYRILKLQDDFNLLTAYTP
ncbi:MAG: glycoside hydrolase family 3 protein [Bacillota bacterium]|nr:glycoside hydrolase family 3 protein [Bacillota bacterium]